MVDPRSSISAIINENLSLLAREDNSVAERRLAQLRDRALWLLRDDSLLDSDNRTDEFASVFDVCDEYESPAETKAYLDSTNRSQLCSDKLAVCMFLAEDYKKRNINILSRLLRDEPYGDSVKIAYFRNAYADAAFRTFSELIENPSVIYASDFTAVCEEVYYGHADMCMLPLDSSRDAKLISFYRLIDKYELSPVFSCDVSTPDGNVTTRYALLKRSIALPNKAIREKCPSCFFEFSLTPSDGETLCDVLAAAGECGLTLYKVDSIPLTYNENEFACDVILNVGGDANLDAFVLFLTLAVIQYEPLGIYPHIRRKI